MSADERDFLERSLADLERERAAGDLADDDYSDLKARYQAKLANLERSGPIPRRTSDGEWDQNEPRGRRGRGSLVLTALVVIAVGVGGGFGVAAWSGARKPGETATGSVPSTTDERIQQASARFQAGDASGAIALYREVLDEDPKNVRALTYLGWTLRNAAPDDPRAQEAAVGFISRALEIDEDFAEAWFFRGIIYLRDEGDTEKAVQALRLAIANDAEGVVGPSARELLAEIVKTSTTTAP